MDKDQKITFAVLGYGHIGRRHAEMIARHPEASLQAVIDENEGLEELLREKFPQTPFFSSLEEYLGQSKAEVMMVCTPNGLHAVHAKTALASGHHVVIEKPMALTKADCESIIFEALHYSKQVFCVMQNRFSPPSQWLKKLVDEDLLGKIYLVEINCYWNRDQRYYNGQTWKGNKDLDGGTLFTQFSHFVDVLYWVFGDIKNIQSKFRDCNHQSLTDFEDTGLIQFDLVRGGMGVLTYSTAVWNRNMESSLTAIGEKGSLKIGGQYMEKVVYCHLKDYEMPQLPKTNAANDYGSYKGSANNHHYVIENVIDTLKNRSKIYTNALEGMKVVEMIERIYDRKV